MYRQKLRINEVRVGMKIAEPIFAVSDSGTNILVSQEDVYVTEKLLNVLYRQSVKTVVVHSKNPAPEYGDQLAREKALRNRVMPMLEEKFKNEAIDGINSLFSAFNDSSNQAANRTTAFQTIKNLDKILEHLVAAVSTDSRGAVHIHDLKKFDEYTYHHSLSVAVLSIAIGQELGMDFRSLIRLSRCAVLHDIGKLSIPVEILHKKSALTKDEFEVIKQHTKYSFLNLKNQAYGDTELWTGVMYHHEKINGGGYPRGLQNEEIPLFSRIIAVADMYDAVTSYRPYRDPMTPSDAYDLLMSEVGKSFEYKIVEALLKRLILYPINTEVTISDGRSGYVVDNENALRPTIKIKDTQEMVDLASKENLDISIIKVLGLSKETS